MKYLSIKEFLNLVDNTPLISIDLIVRNNSGRVLLGLRNNQPAKGYWFVPGGRIHKNQSFETAFRYTISNELGLQTPLEEATFLGCYEHFYKENFANAKGITTHYVVLAFSVEVDEGSIKYPIGEQHADWQWMSETQILKSKLVHIYTKNYFDNTKACFTIR